MTRQRNIPTLEQARGKIDTRSHITLARHESDAAHQRAKLRAEQRHLAHTIFGRISPGLRASLQHRRASLVKDIEANLF